MKPGFILGLALLLLVLQPLVLAEETELKELEINIPTDIKENEDFNITITSNETIVEDAVVIYNNSINDVIETTDVNGKVTLSAPMITDDRQFIKLTFFTAKNGYVANETMVNITNLPNLIFKDKENNYYRARPGESVLIIIIDNLGVPVENAEIEITTDYKDVISTYYTDKNGEVTIVAPNNQSYEEYFRLVASKPGYSSSEQSLTVHRSSADEGVMFAVFLFVCPIIFFVFIAIIIIVIIYSILRKKEKENNEESDKR